MTKQQKLDHLLLAHKTTLWERLGIVPMEGATWAHSTDHEWGSKHMIPHIHDKETP